MPVDITLNTVKFLVTGGTGFIGACVVRNLLRRGIAVVSADLNADEHTLATFAHEAQAHGASCDAVTMDVGDFRDVMSVFHTHPDITHCIHLAYVMGPLVDENTSLSTRVNITGMTHMFEMARHRRLQRLIFTSSETVYGPSQKPYGDRPVTEDDFCDPASHVFTYAVMKLLNEHIGRNYVRRHGLSIACTRPPVVFGHGRKRSAVMWAEHFASLPAVGKPVTLPFPAATRDTWLHKEDCAEQLVRLALAPRLNHFVYNHGGTCISAGELAAIVRRFIPEAQISFDESKPGTPLIDNMDGSRLIREIGFVPRPIEQGVRDHIEEARKDAAHQPRA
ncbi:MAG: NAD(P)-dependent oxidoreductase [Phycisphaerae bacterium]|nr:NAD(P)-dependent oxidoreductase [Phycisphaerae bacterium]MDW8262494.1 NAD(P)-dependent oxidoreductase [Phycisphaerales bacterium]